MKMRLQIKHLRLQPHLCSLLLFHLLFQIINRPHRLLYVAAAHTSSIRVPKCAMASACILSLDVPSRQRRTRFRNDDLYPDCGLWAWRSWSVYFLLVIFLILTNLPLASQVCTIPGTRRTHYQRSVQTPGSAYSARI